MATEDSRKTEPVITDVDRMKWLFARGYLPKLIDITQVDPPWGPSQFMDWAIKNHYGPAYWRQPENAAEVDANCPPEGNGLVFVKPMDRARIDQLILGKESVPV